MSIKTLTAAAAMAVLGSQASADENVASCIANQTGLVVTSDQDVVSFEGGTSSIDPAGVVTSLQSSFSYDFKTGEGELTTIFIDAGTEENIETLFSKVLVTASAYSIEGGSSDPSVVKGHEDTAKLIAQCLGR